MILFIFLLLLLNFLSVFYISEKIITYKFIYNQLYNELFKF